MTSNVIFMGNRQRITGTWKYRDGFSDVEYTFSIIDGLVKVSILDTSDKERPEIYDVEWSEAELTLRFAAHWSTGRLVKYHVAIGPDPNRLQATITTTSQELWERQ